jgi:hypothetical protein
LAAIIPMMSPNITWSSETITPKTFTPVQQPQETELNGDNTPQLVWIIAVGVVLIMGSGVIIIGCQADKKLNPKPPKNTNSPPQQVTMSMSSIDSLGTLSGFESFNSSGNVYAAWIMMDRPGERTAFHGSGDQSAGGTTFGCDSPNPLGQICMSKFSRIPVSEYVTWEEFLAGIAEYGIHQAVTNNYGFNGVPTTHNAMNIRMEDGVLKIGNDANPNKFKVERATLSPTGTMEWQPGLSVSLPPGLTPTFIDGGSSDNAVFYRTVREAP